MTFLKKNKKQKTKGHVQTHWHNGKQQVLMFKCY